MAWGSAGSHRLRLRGRPLTMASATPASRRSMPGAAIGSKMSAKGALSAQSRNHTTWSRLPTARHSR